MTAAARAAHAFVLHEGDVRARLRDIPDESVQCIVTSPPYWNLRMYATAQQIWGGRPTCWHAWDEYVAADTRGTQEGTLDGGMPFAPRRFDRAGAFCRYCDAWRGELGLEPTPDLFIQHLVEEVLAECWRVLRPDGTLWVNLGDSYASGGNGGGGTFSDERRAWKGADERKGWRAPPAGLKHKDLALIPQRFAIAAQAWGWWVRMDNIWAKRNCQPESVSDRPTKAHEYVLLLCKSETPYYDAEAVKERAVGGASGNKTRKATHQPLSRGTRQGRGFPWEGAPTRNLRSVWWISPAQADWDYCLACDTFLHGNAARNRIRVEIVGPDGKARPAPDDWWARDDGHRARELKDGEREVRYCPTCRATDRWVDHFAVMPEEVAEKAILAGTSAHGACAACGAPWRRIVEKEGAGRVRTDRGGMGTQERRLPTGNLEVKRRPFREQVVSTTRGWEPTCACGTTEVRPCVVLDPFLGSGTTAAVALNLGRDAIGVELNPAYAALARRRVQAEAPAATARRLTAYFAGGGKDNSPPEGREALDAVPEGTA